MIIPPLLKKEDTISIIAPSRFAEREKIVDFVDEVENRGFRIINSPELFSQYNQVGGTKEQRLNQIKFALENKKVKAVFCARGGFGLIDLLPELMDMDFTKNPKWWIGFSDCTVLHHVLQKQGLASLHASMPMQFKAQRAPKIRMSFNSIFEAITGEKNQLVGVDSKLTGPVYGGNLSMLYALSAANLLRIPDNSILFIEEVDEYLYHIDRMMRALYLAGHISNKLKAIVVGYITKPQDHKIPFGKTAIEIIKEYADLVNTPIIFGIKSGHEHPNYAIKLGVDVTFVSL